jgi:uncharacterized protein YkvS
VFTEFKIKTYIPSLSSFEHLREVNNKDLLLVSKFFSSNDDEGACEYLDSLLPIKDISSLDKFFILLCLRSTCIGDQISLKINTTGQPPATLKVSIKEVIKKLINVQLQKIPDFIKDDLCVKFKIPTKLYYKNLLFLLFDIIEDITVKEKLRSIRLMSEKEKISIIKKLNKDILKDIKQHIANNTQIIDITKIENFNNLKICFTNNLAFKIIKIFFSQNISNLYYKLYHSTQKINLSYESFLSITPAEADLLLTIHKTVNNIK